MSVEFTDESLEPVEFKSSWKRERSVAEQSCQTKDVHTDSVEVQSYETFDQEVQTEYGGDSYKLQGTDADNQALAEFLHKVEPMITQCLNRNLKSRAFDGFIDQRESGSETVTCMHTLFNADLKEELQVTDLSWNATGSTLAASYPC
ncbi:WD repeat-containing protein 34-like [Plakobranchus ocellatus]|uniref:WD repeat-containing protein 34-like n=1 Tax=Plakobranchus ocellatus TaxID=259542 RepID=A0AAV4B1J8_9GAST|nr:WD repeat-containing protein 34-like [Plakobranchus ocellatus]